MKVCRIHTQTHTLAHVYAYDVTTHAKRVCVCAITIWSDRLTKICSICTLTCAYTPSTRTHKHMRTYRHMMPPLLSRTHTHTQALAHVHAHTHKHTHTSTCALDHWLLTSRFVTHDMCLHSG